jgi:hypothetical protein
MKIYILPKGTIIRRRQGLWREWSVPTWGAFVTTREVRFTDADIARKWPPSPTAVQEEIAATWPAPEYIFNLPKNNTLYRQIRVSADQLQIEEQ